MKNKLSLIIIIISLILFSNLVFAQNLEVALISDIGGFSDFNYNQQLKNSLTKAANDFELVVEFEESNLMSQYLEEINSYAQNKFDLIWGVGFTMEQAIRESAQMYPNRNFILFDGRVKEENVKSLIFNRKEAGFLAGLTAGLETNTKTVAFIGGKKNKEITEYQLGFEKGVKTVDTEIKIYNEYLASFNDFSRAKKVTEKLAAQKTDIVFYAAGASSKGIIEAALQKNLKLISLAAADIKLAPNNMLTVILKNTDYLVNKIITDYKNGDYKNGIKEYGLAEKALIIDQDQAKDMMTAKNINKIEEYKQRYLSH